MDRPLTEEQKGRHDLLDYLRGHDARREDRFLQEALHTRLADLRAWGELLSRAMQEASKVTIGNPEVLRENEAQFEQVERLS